MLTGSNLVGGFVAVARPLGAGMDGCSLIMVSKVLFMAYNFVLSTIFPLTTTDRP